MDYRNRKYYLVYLGGYKAYEYNLNKLKEEIKSLKIRPAYNHFKGNNNWGYDGMHFSIFKGSVFAQLMMSCKIEESEKFEDAFKMMIIYHHYFKPVFVEITKEVQNEINEKIEEGAL